MPVNFSGAFGGSNSGGLFGAGARTFGSPYAALLGTGTTGGVAPKKDEPHGIGGFFSNLGSDIKGLYGIIPGVYNLGKSAVHDAGKAVGLASGPYELDDVAGSIYDSYTAPGTFWGEGARANLDLITGDLSGYKKHTKKAWGAFYDAPLGPILDIGAVFTGGGTLAGKTAAKIAAETGSARAAKLAGLQRVDKITPSTIRPVSGKAGNFAAATRPIVDSLTGKTLHEMPVSSNPVIRARRNLMEGAYSKLSASHYMSPTRRGARLSEAETRRVARREAATIEKAYLGAFNRLGKNERDALFYMAQGFNTPERLTQLATQRLERAKELSATKATTAKGSKIAADVGDLTRDARVIRRVMPHVESPSPALLDALEQQTKLNEVTQRTFFRNLVREGKTPEQANTIIMERAQGPMRAVGIEPGTELPVTITHGVDADTMAKRNASLERGLATKILDEEKRTDYSNFLNARYVRDPSVQLTTHRVMFAKEQTFDRIERALSKAEPYDHAKHDRLVASGELRHVTKNDALLDDLRFVDDSLDRLERDLGDFTDAEFDQLREAYDAMHSYISGEHSPGVVLPTAHYEELAKQFRGGRQILAKTRAAFRKGTQTWRHIVLSLKGSFYVNNFIGNALLGFVAYGPRFMLETARESMPRKLRDSLSARITSDVSDLERTAGARSIGDKNLSRVARLNVIDRLGEKVAAKGVLLTEDNFRRAAFRTNLNRKVKEYRAATGKTRHDAIEEILNDRSAVDQLAEATYGDLLDYSKLTPIEKELLLPVLPFWNFTRAMTGRTIRLTLDEPWKMRVLLYAGQSGIEANEDALPDDLELPEFLKGLILLDPTGDTPRVLSTYGANPFIAPADLAMQIGSVTGKTDGSPNPFSSFNPFVKAPLEAITGREIENFDGSEPNSLAGRTWTQLQKNVPQWAMLQRYRYPSTYPSIDRDAGDTLAQYAGIPVGDLNIDNIRRVNEIVAAIEARDEAARQRRIEAKQELRRF